MHTRFFEAGPLGAKGMAGRTTAGKYIFITVSGYVSRAPITFTRDELAKARVNNAGIVDFARSRARRHAL